MSKSADLWNAPLGAFSVRVGRPAGSYPALWLYPVLPAPFVCRDIFVSLGGTPLWECANFDAARAIFFAKCSPACLAIFDVPLGFSPLLRWPKVLASSLRVLCREPHVPKNLKKRKPFLLVFFLLAPHSELPSSPSDLSVACTTIIQTHRRILRAIPRSSSWGTNRQLSPLGLLFRASF